MRELTSIALASILKRCLSRIETPLILVREIRVELANGELTSQKSHQGGALAERHLDAPNARVFHVANLLHPAAIAAIFSSVKEAMLVARNKELGAINVNHSFVQVSNSLMSSWQVGCTKYHLFELQNAVTNQLT